MDFVVRVACANRGLALALLFIGINYRANPTGWCATKRPKASRAELSGGKPYYSVYSAIADTKRSKASNSRWIRCFEDCIDFTAASSS